MYKTTDEIFVRINRNGHIPFIGICGPIPNPIKISTEICLKLVNAGVDVHQYDPATKQTVKLTRENVFDDEKFTKKKEKSTIPVQTPVTNPSAPIDLRGVQKKVETPVKQEEVKADEAVVESSADAVESVKEESVDEKAEEVKADEAVVESNSDAVESVKEESVDEKAEEVKADENAKADDASTEEKSDNSSSNNNNNKQKFNNKKK